MVGGWFGWGGVGQSIANRQATSNANTPSLERCIHDIRLRCIFVERRCILLSGCTDVFFFTELPKIPSCFLFSILFVQGKQKKMYQASVGWFALSPHRHCQASELSSKIREWTTGSGICVYGLLTFRGERAYTCWTDGRRAVFVHIDQETK